MSARAYHSCRHKATGPKAALFTTSDTHSLRYTALRSSRPPAVMASPRHKSGPVAHGLRRGTWRILSWSWMEAEEIEKLGMGIELAVGPECK